MKEREYKFTLTEENKSKVEQFLKLMDIDANIVESENIKEEPEEKEWPQDGDDYYFIVSEGLIDDDYFYPEDAPCECRIAIGNCFETREEAEFEVEQLKVLAEMKVFAEPDDNEWDGENVHWSIWGDMPSKSVFYIPFNAQKSNLIYFESREEAEKCVEVVGEDRIKKYYLGIKE